MNTLSHQCFTCIVTAFNRCNRTAVEQKVSNVRLKLALVLRGDEVSKGQQVS
jgi:hypothetical protein